MRPRRARLGCVMLATDLDPTSTPCFNEAEARAPRMRRRCDEHIAVLHRFNEAEARAPRMQACAVGVRPREPLLQ